MEDWPKESGIMGSIYRNSLCTLAVSSEDNSNGCCFIRRNLLLYRPCCLSGGPTDRTYAFGHGYPKEHAAGSICESKLFTGGWVFQERPLSPRKLYYGSTRVSWECVTSDTTECHPIIADLTMNGDAEALSLKRLYGFVEKAVVIWWADIVTQYSDCSLTKTTDKLAAIHWVVQELQRKTNFVYVPI